MYAFNTVSAAVRFLAANLWDLVITAIFNDFPQVEAEALALSAQVAFSELRELVVTALISALT